jgi:hypothetical protein
MSAALKTGPTLLRGQPSPWRVGVHLRLRPLRTFGPDSTRRSARGIQSDAANGLRVGVLWTLMAGIIELALRQVPRLPKPVLDHFPHDRGILGWPDAA